MALSARGQEYYDTSQKINAAALQRAVQDTERMIRDTMGARGLGVSGIAQKQLNEQIQRLNERSAEMNMQALKTALTMDDPFEVWKKQQDYMRQLSEQDRMRNIADQQDYANRLETMNAMNTPFKYKDTGYRDMWEYDYDQKHQQWLDEMSQKAAMKQNQLKQNPWGTLSWNAKEAGRQTGIQQPFFDFSKQWNQAHNQQGINRLMENYDSQPPSQERYQYGVGG